MKRSFLQIQTTSNWAQIWCGGWNCELIEVYQISAKSETKNVWRLGLVCFGHKSGLAHPPFRLDLTFAGSFYNLGYYIAYTYSLVSLDMHGHCPYTRSQHSSAVLPDEDHRAQI